jgi:hypothetical protein
LAFSRACFSRSAEARACSAALRAAFALCDAFASAVARGAALAAARDGAVEVARASLRRAVAVGATCRTFPLARGAMLSRGASKSVRGAAAVACSSSNAAASA